MSAHVTVSIDDAVQHDLRTAELLSRHGLRATFYVPARGPRELEPAQLRELDADFELGSHSFSHIDLSAVELDEALRDVREGKAWLDDALGHETVSFAYPFGRFTGVLASRLAGEGLACARTCLLNRTDSPSDPYRMPITTDARVHPRRVQVAHALRERNYRGLRNYAFVFRLQRDWEAHFRRALEVVAADGGVAHLVIHSDQIDAAGAWAKLERVLAAAAASGLAPATNTEAASG